VEKYGLDRVKENFEQIDSKFLVGDILYEQAKVSNIAIQNLPLLRKEDPTGHLPG